MTFRKLRKGRRQRLGCLSPWLLPCQAALPGFCTIPPKASAPIRWPFPAVKPLTRFQEILPFLVPLGLRSSNGFLLLTLPVLLISLTPVLSFVSSPFPFPHYPALSCQDRIDTSSYITYHDLILILNRQDHDPSLPDLGA